MLHEVLPDAVYCCVKTFMRDCQLQQPPELCIPPREGADNLNRPAARLCKPTAPDKH